MSSSAAARSATAKVAPVAPARPQRRNQRRRWREAGADAENGGDDGGGMVGAAQDLIATVGTALAVSLCGWLVDACLF